MNANLSRLFPTNRCLLAPALSLVCASLALAEEPKPATAPGPVDPQLMMGELSPYIVTAERVEKSILDTPYSSSRIDSNSIRDNALRTLPEALQYTPGVMVQETAYGHGSPFIRGFTGRQNLLLMDGIRVNNSTFRGGPVQYWNTIDSLSLDHLELIRSQGSVLYGSDAAGGTLNAFGKSSDFRSETTDQPFLGGSAAYEYRSNGEGSHIARFEAETGVGGQYGILLGVSAKDFGDIADSAVGRMKGTGYPEQDYDLRFDYAVTADSTLTFAAYYVNQDDISRWHRTLNNPGWTDGDHIAGPGAYKFNDYDQEHALTYLRYAGKNPEAGAAIKSWSSTLSFQKVGDSEYLDANNGSSTQFQALDTQVRTLGYDLMLESDLGPGTLVYGGDYYHDGVDSSGWSNSAAGNKLREKLPVADDSTYDMLGLFSQYTWKPVTPLEVTVGARYTNVEADLGRFYGYDAATATTKLQHDQSFNWDSVVGSGRVLYHLNSSRSVYGGISQAFRAPNLNDLSGDITSLASTSSKGSVDAQPEKFVTYEIGTHQANKQFSSNFAVFYTDITDAISSVKDGSTSITTNAAQGAVYGTELEGAWRITPQWELSGYVAWMDGRTEAPEKLGGPVINKPNSKQMPLTGSVALRWTAESKDYWIEGRVLAADTEDRITVADQAADFQRIPTGGTPGYVIAALRAGWQVNDALSLNASLENLTDEVYRVHGSGQNSPGFNGIFGVKVSW